MKQRIRLILLLSALLTIAGQKVAYAASVEYLTLNINEEPVVIVLAEHPVITYQEDFLHIQTAERTIDVQVSQITGATFSETTDIREVGGQPIEFADGFFVFSQLPARSKITVYTVDGREILTTTVDKSGRAAVCIKDLPAGIYVVKSAKQTIKITSNNNNP